jgi:maleate isomerase
MENNPQARLGAIYPDDAWVDVEAEAVVQEFERFMPAGVELVSVATPIPAVDNTLLVAIQLAVNGDIEEAARRLSHYDPVCFAYYCTTISFARGPGGDIDIARRITDRTGKPSTTTSTAMIEAFRALGISRVAVASPYLPDVERQFIDFIEAHDVKVLRNSSLCLKRDHSIVPPDDIRRLAESTDIEGADAVFIGCTGQKLAVHIQAMEARLGKPVLTANQVTSWQALRIMVIDPKLTGRGRLFS